MSRQHCENYNAKWEKAHYYPRNVDFVLGNIEILWKQNSLFPSGPLLHVIRGDLMLLLESQRVFPNLLLFCFAV